MQFHIITIFPAIFSCYFKESILKKAQEEGVIDIQVHNLRDFSSDKRKTVDEKPFGGGRGMVIKIEPVYKAVLSLKMPQLAGQASSEPSGILCRAKTILFTPRGKRFNQKKAVEFSKLDQLILICGRYEGVDERVAKHIADERISIGNYVLMGGELAALSVIEAVARLVPGVVGKSEELSQRIVENRGFIEYPQYSRPEVFRADKNRYWRVPKVLLSGSHKEIQEWREKHSKIIG